MFRTSRTARRGRAALTWLGELPVAGPERRAARSARGFERQVRENEYSAAARAAALEAERRRFPSNW